MKDFEIPFYENYCKRCECFARCLWLHISNDTCLEMTAFKEKKENGNNNERKEKTLL